MAGKYHLGSNDETSQSMIIFYCTKRLDQPRQENIFLYRTTRSTNILFCRTDLTSQGKKPSLCFPRVLIFASVSRFGKRLPPHPPLLFPTHFCVLVKIINDDIHLGLFLFIFPYDRHPACLHSLNVFMFCTFLSVLRIRDILVRIRIRTSD
jgi:hypothetical protein